MAKRPSIPKHNSFTAKAQGKANKLITNVYIEHPIQAKESGAQSSPPNGPEFTAIWDTGATNSSINAKVVEKQNLPQIGMTKVQHADGLCDQPVFAISIYLPNKLVIPFVKSAKGEFGKDCDVLIGMDVINQGDFAITNRNNQTWFTFRIPSIQHINFVDFQPHPEKPCMCGSGKTYKNCCL